MKKPHEEEWYQSSGGTVRVRNHGNTLVGEFAHAQREGLATAAPDMARELLEIRDAINSGTLSLDDLQEVAERPLRTAGIL